MQLLKTVVTVALESDFFMYTIKILDVSETLCFHLHKGEQGRLLSLKLAFLPQDEEKPVPETPFSRMLNFNKTVDDIKFQ